MANLTTIPSGWIIQRGSSPATYYTAGQTIPTPINGDLFQKRSSSSVANWNMDYTYYNSWTSPIGGKTYTNCWVMCIGFDTDLTGAVSLPAYDSIGGKPVVGIYSPASAAHAKFTSVTGLVSGMKYVRFPNVTTLASISTSTGTLPGRLEVLNLEGCTSLQSIPEIPESVTVLDSAFKGCTSLSGTITINCKATSYTDCFKNTTQDIVLFGKGNLVQLAQTANNRNVRIFQLPKWKMSI